MHKSSVVLALSLALAACGGDDSATGSPDLKGVVSTNDLTTTTVVGDMAVTKNGCNGYLNCYIGCFSDSTQTQAMVTQCTTDCGSAAMTKTEAKTKFSTAQICSQSWCICGATQTLDTSTLTCATGDGAAGAFYKCGIDSMGNFTEANGSAISSSGTGPCDTCLNNASASLFGQSCPSPSSVDCNPSVCTASVNACLNDLP